MVHGGPRGVAGLGWRVLQPEGADSLWERYMRGESTAELYRWLLAELVLEKP